MAKAKNPTAAEVLAQITDEVDGMRVTRLDRSVGRAVEAHRAFKAAEARLQRGLTPAAFLKEALSNACVGAPELSELAKTLDRPGFEAAKSGIDAIVRQFTRTDGIRASRPQKRLKYFWDDAGRTQLGAAGATELQGYALGVKLAVSLHPEAFGPLDTWESGENEINELRLELAEALRVLEISWGAADVVVDGDGRVTLRRWPSVQITGIDFAQRVLDAALAAPSAKAKAA